MVGKVVIKIPILRVCWSIQYRLFFCSVHRYIVKTPTMKETPWRRITVTSSLNEISTGQQENKMGVKGEVLLRQPLQQASGQLLKTT